MPKAEDHTPSDAKQVLEQLRELTVELEQLVQEMRSVTKAAGLSGLRMSGPVNGRLGVECLTRYNNQLSAAIRLQNAKNRKQRGT